MKELNVKTSQYQYDEFIVTIFEYETTTSVWLAHEDYGIMQLMFDVTDKENLMRKIENNLEEYEYLYRSEVMDD